jgi:hypothetical protein
LQSGKRQALTKTPWFSIEGTKAQEVYAESYGENQMGLNMGLNGLGFGLSAQLG